VAVISFQPNNSQNRLFASNKRSYLGFVVALLLSLALMISDSHYRKLDRVRSGISIIVSPLQILVGYPAHLTSWAVSFFGSKNTLMRENTELRYKQMILEAQLQKLLVLSRENAQLKELLSASAATQLRAMAAHILAVDTSTSRQLLVLNKGTRDGVVVGLPVFDAKGVMGQIIDVGLMTSTVLLVSDAKSAVPVRNERTGERTILMGINSMTRLSLVNIPRTSSVVRGDFLITSGLGRRYPEGYPVGRVEEIINTPGDDFIKVMVSPVALLNKANLVLIIWPEEEHEQLSAQINERMSVMDKNIYDAS
jgi:rod shape-determining protein MreC